MQAASREFSLILVGYGQRGVIHARELAARADCTISAIVEPDADRMLAAKRDYPEANLVIDIWALGDIGASGIIISSPPEHRRVYIDWALDRGIPIFCEKPLALSLEEGRHIVDACARRGVSLMQGYTTRYKWPYRDMRELFAQGHLGDLVTTWFSKTEYFEDQRWQGINASEHWRSKMSSGGGRHLERSHQLDWMLWVGGKPERVEGAIATVAPNAKVDDVYSAYLKFATGVGLITVALTPFTGEHASVGIVGTLGSAIFDGKTLTVKTAEGETVTTRADAASPSYYGQIVRFLETGTRADSDEISAMQTLEAALALEGRH